MILLQIITGFLITFVVAACYIIMIAFTIWMLVDAAKQDRFWWLTVILGVPIIGPAAYYFTEKKHEYARALPHHMHTSETESQHERAPKKRTSRRVKKEDTESTHGIKQDETPQETEIIQEEIHKEEVGSAQ